MVSGRCLDGVWKVSAGCLEGVLVTIRYYSVHFGTVGHYWVLVATIGVQLGTFVYYWVLLGTNGYYWVLLSSIRYFGYYPATHLDKYQNSL